jgi:hypothetical protein
MASMSAVQNSASSQQAGIVSSQMAGPLSGSSSSQIGFQSSVNTEQLAAAESSQRNFVTGTNIQRISSDSASETNQAKSQFSTSSATETKSTKIFTTLTTFLETVTFDMSFKVGSLSVSFDILGDTRIESLSRLPPAQLNSVLSSGVPIPDQIATSKYFPTGCFQEGAFPTEDVDVYMQCSPNGAGSFLPTIRQCGREYVFNPYAGQCTHGSALSVLRDDFGIRLGPGPELPAESVGEASFYDFSQFPGVPSQCSNVGLFPFGGDDRFFLACTGANTQGKTSTTDDIHYNTFAEHLRCIKLCLPNFPQDLSNDVFMGTSLVSLSRNACRAIKCR